MANRAYKTLPSAFRKENGSRVNKRNSTENNQRSSSRSSNEPLFSGLELKLGLTNLISNGMNLIGQLRRKTPTAVNSPASTSASSPDSSSGGAYWECRSKLSERGDAKESSTATSANVSELIEMTSFKTVAEGDMEHQSGRGHVFQGMSSFNPIW